MRVLVVSEVMWPEGGGGELATYLWVRALSGRLSVTLLSSRLNNGVKRELERIGASVVELGFLDTRSRIRLWRSIWANREKIRKALASIDYDVAVITRLAYPLIPIIKRGGEYRVVVHLHDYVSIDPSGLVVSHRYGGSLLGLLGPKAYLKRLLARIPWSLTIKLLDSADGAVFVSHRQRDIICSKRPSLCTNHEVVPNPLPPQILVDPESLKEDLEKLLGGRFWDFKDYVLFSGGLSSIKGFDIVRRMARVLAKEWGIATVVIKAGFRGFDADRGIIYLPRLSYGRYWSLLTGSKALLHPSIHEEPLPYAIVESVLAGIPPIVTRVGGIPEIVGTDYPGFVEDISEQGLRGFLGFFFSNYDSIRRYVVERSAYLKSEWAGDKLAGRLTSFLGMLAGEAGC
jgi:glycosyltransferase involved in cell wall biosynthesis